MKVGVGCFCLLFAAMLLADEKAGSQVLVRDIASVEGVRDNPLLGYGIVVGLNGTGDRTQTVFTVQTLANTLQRMGVQVSPSAVRVNNVAGVFVTASLPPFALPGTRLDVTVSSTGDAKSLEGGLLLLTPLHGADGEVYAEAQGALTLGGYTAGRGGNTKVVNHPTVGRIPLGGTVERSSAIDLRRLPQLALVLREANFSAAEAVAKAINQAFDRNVAQAMDSRRIDIHPSAAEKEALPALLARIENVGVTYHAQARVVVNERTGTVVIGKEVRLSAVSILHGNLTVEITTALTVSQPEAFSPGQTAVVAEPNAKAEEAPARKVELTEGASVEQLVNGLQAMGATARDVIAILQALKAEGALQADLEVI